MRHKGKTVIETANSLDTRLKRARRKAAEALFDVLAPKPLTLGQRVALRLWQSRWAVPALVVGTLLATAGLGFYAAILMTSP